MLEINNLPAPSAPFKRQTIEGQVQIKRKTQWVSRYAQIKDAYFQYKLEPYDTRARYFINLRQATVKKGKLPSG